VTLWLGEKSGGSSHHIATSSHTAVLSKTSHVDCCTTLTNRPLRPREGRFVRVVRQLACEVFARTAVVLEHTQQRLPQVLKPQTDYATFAYVEDAQRPPNSLIQEGRPRSWSYRKQRLHGPEIRLVLQSSRFWPIRTRTTYSPHNFWLVERSYPARWMVVVHLFCTVVHVGIGQNWGDCNISLPKARSVWACHARSRPITP